MVYLTLWGNTLYTATSVKCIPLHSSGMTSPALFVYRGLSHGHSSHTRLPSRNEERPISQNNRKLYGDKKSLLPPVSGLC